MKVFPALGTVEQQIHGLLHAGCRRCLISFVYDKPRTFAEKVGAVTDIHDVDFILDSGAFTAWTLGQDVDLDEYADWAKWWLDRKDGRRVRVVNLDLIPGKPGHAPTKREINRSAKKSAENAQALRELGLSVVEVFHPVEGLDALDAILERRQPNEIVGIGSGQAGGRTNVNERRKLLDRAFAHLRDNYQFDHFPPIHGFGCAAESPLATRYPWYSIDASSWNIFDRYGAEVRRDGRLQKRSPHAKDGSSAPPGKAQHRDVAKLYYHRVASRWVRLEHSLTDLWRARGVLIDVVEDQADVYA